MRLIKAFLIIVTWHFAFSAESDAATITAASCSSANVQAAINSAQDGDTVVVPAGNCTSRTAVSINNKTITLQGAESVPGGTKITYGGSNHTLIDVQAGSKTGKMDISGFWLSGGNPNYWSGTAMQLYGPAGSKNLRVHHIVLRATPSGVSSSGRALTGCWITTRSADERMGL